MNLIVSKVIEQLYGFFRTHVALYASRSAMWCIGQAAQQRRWTDFPHPDRNNEVDTFGARAGRFCPLALLDRTCGGAAPRRAIRLASDQNRRGQMNQSNYISL
ncbi:MAG: hypothetical protein AAGA00_08445 [Pseudomonadota bacterium]